MAAGGKREGAGRKPAPNKRDKKLTLRFTEKELEEVKAALSRGKSQSDELLKILRNSG